MTDSPPKFKLCIQGRRKIHDEFDGKDYYLDENHSAMELCIALNEFRETHVELIKQNRELRNGVEYKELEGKYEDLKDRYNHLEYKMNSLKRMIEKGY